MKHFIIILGLTLSVSSYAAVTRCKLVKTDDLAKKEKAPTSIVITMIGAESFRYTFTHPHGKKLVKCKIPKAKEGGPLDKDYLGYEYYAIASEEPIDCMDAYLDLKSKAESKKAWTAVFLTNTDGTATYSCK